MLKIIEVVAASDNEWDVVWNVSNSATYYHSRQWAEIWQTYTDGAILPIPKKIIFSDGVEVILPIMRRNYYNGIIKRYALTGPPFLSKYGNWLTRDSLNKVHLVLLTEYIIKRYKNITWQLNPFDYKSRLIEVNSKYTKRYPEITYAIDLSKGEETIYSNFKKSCRNHIKQAINNDLVAKVGTEPIYWRKYFELYLDTVKRWGGRAPYTLKWKLFEIIYKKYNQNTKLWLVWYKDIPIAGAINFYSNSKIMAWHMSSLTAYRNLRPVHYLEYAMIKDGIANDYVWYDFGTDAGQKGLADFKRSFGPEKIMCDKLVSWNPIISCALNLKNKLKYNKNVPAVNQ
jgi:hypothetical protein